MKLLYLIPVIALSACSTAVPVTAKFPEVPAEMIKDCGELKQLSKDARLSGVAATVTENYTLYHECSQQNRAWREWYEQQRKIFESVK